MGEVSNLMQNPTNAYVNPTAVIRTETGTLPYSEDNMQNNKDSDEVNPSPENQLERESAITENFTAGKVQSTGKYLMY